MANFKHVLRHKPTGRFLGPASRQRGCEKLSIDKLTKKHLGDARVFTSLSAAHNCWFIQKDVDTKIFYKDRPHSGPNFEYEAVPVCLKIIEDT